jgi:hypothetical protein
MHSLLSDRFLKKFVGKRKNRQSQSSLNNSGQESEAGVEKNSNPNQPERDEACEVETGKIKDSHNPDEGKQQSGNISHKTSNEREPSGE